MSPLSYCASTGWRGQRSLGGRASPRETCDAVSLPFLIIFRSATPGPQGLWDIEVPRLSVLKTSLRHLLCHTRGSNSVTTPNRNEASWASFVKRTLKCGGGGAEESVGARFSEVPGSGRVRADGGVGGTFQVGGTSQRMVGGGG